MPGVVPTHRPPNRLLTLLGLALVVMAGVGYYLNKNATLTGTFLFLGVACSIFAVFEPRMVGQQKLSLQGLTINLSQAGENITATESDRAAGRIQPVDEVVA